MRLPVLIQKICHTSSRKATDTTGMVGHIVGEITTRKPNLSAFSASEQSKRAPSPAPSLLGSQICSQATRLTQTLRVLCHEQRWVEHNQCKRKARTSVCTTASGVYVSGSQIRETCHFSFPFSPTNSTLQGLPVLASAAQKGPQIDTDRSC